MKLNGSKTKTMIVSRSLAMHPQSPPLTNGGTVLAKSDDLDILGVTIYSKVSFEKHLRSVSKAASLMQTRNCLILLCTMLSAVR